VTVEEIAGDEQRIGLACDGEVYCPRERLANQVLMGVRALAERCAPAAEVNVRNMKEPNQVPPLPASGQRYEEPVASLMSFPAQGLFTCRPRRGPCPRHGPSLSSENRDRRASVQLPFPPSPARKGSGGEADDAL